MYPTLSFAIEDLLGIKLALPIQMFGFWVAIAFLLAASLLRIEFRRMEQQGYIKPLKQMITIGQAPQFMPILMAVIGGFLVGFKLIEAILHYSDLVSNPQDFLLSTRGHVVGGIVIAVLSGYNNYRSQKKQQLPKPIRQEQTIHVEEHTGNILIVAAIAGLIGAKVFHNLENIDQLIADPMGALLSFSGLTFYGGLVVAGIVLWQYTKRLGIGTSHMLDIGALALTLGYGIGRIGCHTSGDGDWGIVANWGDKMPGFMPEWFWQYDYPNNVLNAGVAIKGYVGQFSHVLPQPVYPTPMWETIIALTVFTFLWFIRKKLPAAGMLSGLYLILMGFERFFIEKIRVNTTYEIFGNQITQAEIISTISVLAGIFILVYVSKNKERFAFKPSTGTQNLNSQSPSGSSSNASKNSDGADK